MGTPRLHCFPNDDAAFRGLAEALFKRAGRDDPAWLQRALRVSYPNAVVRRQQPLATLNSGDRVWYVYRDGHYIAPHGHDANHSEGIAPDAA
jgi:hypothetical protein